MHSRFASSSGRIGTQGIATGSTGAAGNRLSRHSTRTGAPGRRRGRGAVLAVERENLAPDKVQRERIVRTPVRGVARGVDLEGGGAEVDDQRLAPGVGRVPVPGDADIAAYRESHTRRVSQGHRRSEARPGRHGCVAEAEERAYAGHGISPVCSLRVSATVRSAAPAGQAGRNPRRTPAAGQVC